MTLDVVGSTPTIYPMNNLNSLILFKNLNLKKISFNLKYNEYVQNIFEFKNFYKKSIKLLYYYYYFEKIYLFDKNFSKNTYYICLNKKKNHYYLCILENNKLYAHISLGTMLIFFNFEKKCFRRTRKGFNIFINVFKKFFDKFNSKNINILLNFIDFNLILIKKSIFRGIFLNNFFLLKFNTPFNTQKYKKYKNIKRRLKKKYIKKYIL